MGFTGYLVTVNGTLTAVKYQENLEHSFIPNLPINRVEKKEKKQIFSKTMWVAILRRKMFGNRFSYIIE